MEEAQAKTNDIRDTIKAEILVREVEGLTAGTYMHLHIAIGLPNLLFLLRTSFFGPSTAMVYWNIQCLFASD